MDIKYVAIIMIFVIMFIRWNLDVKLCYFIWKVSFCDVTYMSAYANNENYLLRYT